ncbi:MAG: site-specific DNA-methyltransferase [PVC group bacterium]|nr:site-specific DNA-methyltransferase [PVC group bacterium]
MLRLIHGDCLEKMDSLINEGIKVDAIITDPPYGTTACKWDSVIPFDEMWKRLNKLIKSNGAIVLFGSEPFSSALRMSNIKNYKYDWVWEKNRGGNFAVLKYQPMKEHENILIFSKKTHMYKPIMQERKGGGLSRTKYSYSRTENSKSEVMGYTPKHAKHNGNSKLRYPSSIQKFNTEVGLHPTQKPVALIEYLIKTYTNENETVLDFTMGSGTTGVACQNLKRNFIGIELDENYFKTAEERINVSA